MMRTCKTISDRGKLRAQQPRTYDKGEGGKEGVCASVSLIRKLLAKSARQAVRRKRRCESPRAHLEASTISNCRAK